MPRNYKENNQRIFTFDILITNEKEVPLTIKCFEDITDKFSLIIIKMRAI